ncbi:MAG: hypothetical protein AMXMBFR58_07250 [Phycisphaerae bacterium]
MLRQFIAGPSITPATTVLSSWYWDGAEFHSVDSGFGVSARGRGMCGASEGSRAEKIRPVTGAAGP